MIDDYNELDWDEELIKQIDIACYKATNPSSSATTITNNAAPFPNSSSHMGSCPKIENNKPSTSRQSTLDGFFGLKSVNQKAINDAQDSVLCNDERATSVSIDPEAAKTWIYPENVPVRDYQVSITRTALFSNTLVSLPTGLGKTLIAAVVIYNYFRWFPQGKIVFAAPSRPLVLQQIEACHNIVGISQEWTVDMTGQISPPKRISLWKEKRIFFVTPQVLEKDIQSGSCLVKQLVCLVIDEAHRASGNYAYCVAVRELMAVPVQMRILALTATPGSNIQTVQQVIDNLQISCLEYRSETDPDVTPYTHDRKVELIQVEMGKDVEEVVKLLMNVMKPLVEKLSKIGIIPRRDPQSMSPIDIVNAREKFRAAPPENLHQYSCNDIEGFYGVLITLYHIRKLLSAHGIRPALGMLEDRLKQGYLARHLSRNEHIHKAKIIMQQNVSHGALSPKFSKMLQVVDEHFKKVDPKKSRVIIFSNYRDCVTDIMSSLHTIGEHVKATEFIGQTSGKSSKGQSQKVQQAVLEKFRAGGYNIIVATSIGEEGLDIMEVDLVICFDSNISPLRMTQRMGRTGRKSKGRVVILACIGSELNGYKKKQAGSKHINRHMLNGGKDSFRFHSSPRMVPHVFRPEKVMVKFMIEEFVHRGKKVKVKDDDNDVTHTPKYKLKLTDVESDLIANYFEKSTENNWRPSLIAFPHFQAFPSRIHQVPHSTRTAMLIDTMQYLQSLSLSKSVNQQDEENLEECFKVESVNSPTTREDVKDVENDKVSVMDPTRSDETENEPPKSHMFLFGTDFTCVDSVGRVVILSVPVFPPTESSLFINCLKPAASLDDNDVCLPEDDKIDGNDREIPNLEVNVRGIPNPGIVIDITHSDDEPVTTEADLSPRLTNLLMSGVVPESPIDNGTPTKVEHCLNQDFALLVSLDQSKNHDEIKDTTPTHGENSTSGSKIMGDLSNKTCSKDWILSSGEKSVSQPKRTLKRLRKYGDVKSGNLLDKQEIVDHTSVSGRSCAQLDHVHARGDKILKKAPVFIEDEAEVSSDASGDEKEEEDSYDDSFIDDRIDPTAATQHDIMAIYRRSLLTQSPIVDLSPNNTTSTNQLHDSGRVNPSFDTNNGNSSSGHLNTKRLSSDTAIPINTDETNENKKRKLSFESFPIRNLEKEIFVNTEETAAAVNKQVSWEMDEFDDDEFYQGIDFDALEAEAAKQLRSKSHEKQPNNLNLDFLGSPSFDLGI